MVSFCFALTYEANKKEKLERFDLEFDQNMVKQIGSRSA